MAIPPLPLHASFDHAALILDGDMQPGYMLPSTDMQIVRNNNLLCAGIAVWDMFAFREPIGLNFSSHHYMVFAAAHLYNACKQLGLLQPDFQWPEMESFMACHNQAVFAAQDVQLH